MASVHLAITAVGLATGIPFVFEGITDEAPSADRPAYQPERYGRRWAPVLISWGSLGTRTAPETTPTGHAKATVVATRGGPVAVSGFVTINADLPDALPAGFGDGRTLGDALLHELGHLIGLDHVADPNQVMSESITTAEGPARWGGGDLEGLRRLGRDSGCLAVPPAQTL